MNLLGINASVSFWGYHFSLNCCGSLPLIWMQLECFYRYKSIWLTVCELIRASIHELWNGMKKGGFVEHFLSLHFFTLNCESLMFVVLWIRKKLRAHLNGLLNRFYYFYRSPSYEPGTRLLFDYGLGWQIKRKLLITCLNENVCIGKIMICGVVCAWVRVCDFEGICGIFYKFGERDPRINFPLLLYLLGDCNMFYIFL